MPLSFIQGYSDHDWAFRLGGLRKEASMQGVQEMGMRNGICSKCGFNDVRVGTQESVTAGQASRFALGIKITDPVHISLTMFVCLRCCYTELYTFEPRDMQSIAERWPRVTPQQSG
jgi:predicted nucleic-acid-binding Zn-ribbon protein